MRSIPVYTLRLGIRTERTPGRNGTLRRISMLWGASSTFGSMSSRLWKMANFWWKHRLCANLRFLATATMIPSLRRQFNTGFTHDKYQTFLRRIDDACGTHVQFRLSETPCFFPQSLLERMAADGTVLIRQLVENPEYRERSDESIPPEFRVPNESKH